MAQPDLRLTAQQNIVLANIRAEDRARVDALLAAYGLSIGCEPLSTLRRYAMACPAMPTLPRPIMPKTLLPTSTPTKRLFSHFPARRLAVAVGI